MRTNIINKILRTAVSVLAVGSVIGSAGAQEASTGEGWNVTFSPAPAVKSVDGSFSARIAGFVQYDYLSTEADETRYDGDDIRRARYGVRGHLGEHWRYDLMFEGSSGENTLFDANVTYSGFDFGKIRMGQFKEPIGLEWSTGAPWWTFSDRALVASLTPKRSVGVAVSANKEKWGAHIGYFSEESTIPKSADEDGVVTGRFYLVPQNTGSSVIHVGFSAVHRVPEDQAVRFKAKHETSIQPSPSMDTGLIRDVESTTTYGVEGLVIRGPLSLQAERYTTDIDSNNTENLQLHAAYVQGSWFLTGETRPYKINSGGFGRIKSKSNGRVGAVELAARYDCLDFDDATLTAGEMDRINVGLNWYATKHIRLTANYLESRTTEAARMSDATLKSIGLRSQFIF